MPALTKAQAAGILGVAPAAASLLWLLGSVMLAADPTLQLLSARLQAAAPAPIGRVSPPLPEPVALFSRPLFAVVAPTTAGGDTTLHLRGIVENPRRSAALIAVGDKPAVWIAVGEMRDGVTLRRVAGESVLLETIDGDKNLTLGGDHAPSGPAIPPSPALAPHR